MLRNWKNSWAIIGTIMAALLLLGCGKKEKEFVATWKAQQVDLGGTMVDASLIGGITLQLNEDLSFVHTEEGNNRKGTWKISDDKKTLDLSYSNPENTISVSIQEKTERIMNVQYEEHGMKKIINFIK